MGAIIMLLFRRTSLALLGGMPIPPLLLSRPGCSLLVCSVRWFRCVELRMPLVLPFIVPKNMLRTSSTCPPWMISPRRSVVALSARLAVVEGSCDLDVVDLEEREGERRRVDERRRAGERRREEEEEEEVEDEEEERDGDREEEAEEEREEEREGEREGERDEVPTDPGSDGEEEKEEDGVPLCCDC